MLKPNAYIHHIADLPIDKLKQKGVTHILLDIDNTLVAAESTFLSPNVQKIVEAIKAHQMVVVLVSNNHQEKVIEIAKKLKVDGYGFSLKPFPFTFWRILKHYQISKKQAVMVGDQYMTDMLFGKIGGCYTILCDPIAKDNVYGVITRFIEKIVLYCICLKRGETYDKL